MDIHPSMNTQYFFIKQKLYQNTFTFMLLADTFIQNYLYYIQVHNNNNNI